MNDIDPSHLAAAAVVAFFAWRFWSFRRVKKSLPELLERGAVVVDVRSPAEFAAGGNPASVNVPLGELDARCSAFDRSKPIVVCCASGTRSAAAAAILRKNGFKDVINAGPWTNTLP